MLSQRLIYTISYIIAEYLHFLLKKNKSKCNLHKY